MQHSSYAPVALFMYNRPIHARKAINALLQCQELSLSPLHIFCDGAKNSKDKRLVIEARNVAKSLMPPHAQLHLSETNSGLAASIKQGVTYLCGEYGKIIVLEDDLLVDRQFLNYMNSALDKYKDIASVMQVSAYRIPVENSEHSDRCVLLPLTTSWGWGTWQDAWTRYDSSAEGWEMLKNDKKTKKLFNVHGAFDYFSMLRDQMEGRSDSWAIRWYWSVFKNKGLVIYPPASLVRNIGFDGSGTHGWRTSRARFSNLSQNGPHEFVFPECSSYDNEAFMEIVEYFRSVNSGLRARLKKMVRKYVR